MGMAYFNQLVEASIIYNTEALYALCTPAHILNSILLVS